MCTTELLTLAAVMVVLDAAWLTARGAASRSMIATLQRSPLTVRLLPAALVYVLMIAGLWWFAVQPAKDWKVAAANGAALGALVYGVYDLTNYSTLTAWPLSYAVADWVWGSVLFATAAAAAVAVR